jgi:hypothetical protein
MVLVGFGSGSRGKESPQSSGLTSEPRLQYYAWYSNVTDSSASLAVAVVGKQLTNTYCAVSLRRPTRFCTKSVQRGNVDSARRNPAGRAGGLVLKNYNSHHWEIPRLLQATDVPCRSIESMAYAGPLGCNIEAVGFDDAIIVATSSQTPILRNAPPRRMMTLFNYCVPLVGARVVVRQMACQTVMTVTTYELLLFVTKSATRSATVLFLGRVKIPCTRLVYFPEILPRPLRCCLWLLCVS